MMAAIKLIQAPLTSIYLYDFFWGIPLWDSKKKLQYWLVEIVHSCSKKFEIIVRSSTKLFFGTIEAISGI
jgi:hypothetical protein